MRARREFMDGNGVSGGGSVAVAGRCPRCAVCGRAVRVRGVHYDPDGQIWSAESCNV